jgi:prephenate dehydratase
MAAPLRVAFQGELGAFGELAIRQLFGTDADAVPQREFRDVAQALHTGTVERAVFPVHNSIVGPVTSSVAALEETPGFAIVDETHVAVRLCVLGVPGSHLDRARELDSHPVALAQVGRWLARHPHISPRAVHDTAGAARLVAERNDPATLALASAVCATHYGLVILAQDVQDLADNVTRFVLVERAAPR